MGHEGQYYVTYVEDDKNGVPHLMSYIVYTWDGLTQTCEWDETQSDYVAQNELTQWGSTGAATYEQLKFDQLTGWSRWLKLNKQFPNFDTVTAGKEWDDSYVINRVWD